MTEQHKNVEAPPAVEPTHDDSPANAHQRNWFQGSNRLLLVLLAALLIYVLTR